MRDYYQVMGVPQEASAGDIKQRYRFLAQAYHPDKFPDPENKEQAEAEFKVVQEAYRVLSDPRQRAAYDRTPVRRADRPEGTPRRTSGPVAVDVEEGRTPAYRPVSFLRQRILGLSMAQWIVGVSFLLAVRSPIPLWDELFLLMLFFTIDPILALLGY